jgi:hypothetical protein
MDHMDDGAEEDAEMEEAAGSEHTPVPEEPAEASAPAGPGGNAAADPSHTHGRIPVSCNKRLKREFRARKSLAGAVPMRCFSLQALLRSDAQQASIFHVLLDYRRRVDMSSAVADVG